MIRRLERGFTLVELMVVVVILAILATVATVGYGKWQQRARRSEAVGGVNDIRMKQDTFYNTYSRYVVAAVDEEDYAGDKGDWAAEEFGLFTWNESCPDATNGWCNLGFKPPMTRFGTGEYTWFQYLTTGWTPNPPFVPAEIDNPNERWVLAKARGLPSGVGGSTQFCTVVLLTNESPDALILTEQLCP